MTPLERCEDCPLNPRAWGKVWGMEISLREELDLYRYMVEKGDRDPETLGTIELLNRRVVMARAATTCCCPEHAEAVASICIEHLLNNKELLRITDLEDPVATEKFRFWWLTECVKDGCRV